MGQKVRSRRLLSVPPCFERLVMTVMDGRVNPAQPVFREDLED